MVSDKGRKISEVFEYMQQFFGECQQLIYKLDSFVDDGWNNMNGSKITMDMSYSLYKPNNWIPEAIFRYYENKDRQGNVKGITICFWKRDECGIEEPIIIVGSMDYGDMKNYHCWDLWNSWFKLEIEHVISDEAFNVYDIQYGKDKIRSGKVFAYPLVKINDNKALKELIVDRLMNL